MADSALRSAARLFTTTSAALEPTDRTAAKIVDFWVNRILGYDASQPAEPQLDTAIRDRLVAFMQQDAAGPDTVLDFTLDGWSNSAWNGYVPQRLQTLVASIAMLPENLLR